VESGSVWRHWEKIRRLGTSSLRQVSQFVNERVVAAKAVEVVRIATETSVPTASWDVDPTQCALLVLGCQTGVLSRIENANVLILKTNAAIDMVRRFGGLVVFMRVALNDLDYRFIPSTNKEFSALGVHQFEKGLPEAEIHPELAIRSGDMLVESTRLGAFSRSDLDERLTNLGVTTLIVSGVDTSGVVLTTVRDAADKDYRLIVLADCTADPDIGTHDLVMSRIFPRQADISTVGQLYGWLTGVSGTRDVAASASNGTGP
jgi:nicotinamidase-related amidase